MLTPLFGPCNHLARDYVNIQRKTANTNENSEKPKRQRKKRAGSKNIKIIKKGDFPLEIKRFIYILLEKCSVFAVFTEVLTE